jgi:hypothetical protein
MPLQFISSASTTSRQQQYGQAGSLQQGRSNNMFNGFYYSCVLVSRVLTP